MSGLSGPPSIKLTTTDAWNKLRAKTVAAPGGGDPQPAGAGFVVFTFSVPRELHLHSPEFIGPDRLAAFADYLRRLGVHKRFWRAALRAIRRVFWDGGEAVAIALTVVFMADGGNEPVNV